jgi:hypothetical protein
MLNDTVVCTTALEVRLLAALVEERRKLSRQIKPLDPKRIIKFRPVAKHISPWPPADFVGPLEVYGPPRPAGHGWRPAEQAALLDILKAVAERWRVTVIDLRSDRRNWGIIVPRHVAVMLCKTLTKSSYPTIGRAFGGRDHTTMLHAATRYDWLRLQLIQILTPQDPLTLWVSEAYDHARLGPVQNHKSPRLVGDKPREQVLSWPFGG